MEKIQFPKENLDLEPKEVNLEEIVDVQNDSIEEQLDKGTIIEFEGGSEKAGNEENSIAFIDDVQNENKLIQPETKLTVEQAINLVIEEKIRLGTLEGNLLAENIIFRLKKGKWD